MHLRCFAPRVLVLFLALTIISADAATPEEKLVELRLSLPNTNPPIANYVPAVRSGSLLFLAGHLPRDNEGKLLIGKAGRDVSEPQASAAAKHATLALLATLKRELGDLAKVKRIVRVGGFVNSTPDFQSHSQVINGCSDLLVAVFGERGRHARTSVGVASLPLNAVVEIEMIVEVE